jgi:hypothetical protein
LTRTLFVSTHQALFLAGLCPYFTKLFLEVIGGVEGLIQPKGFIEALLFPLLLVKMIRTFKKEPSRSLQDILLELILGLPVKVPPEIGQLVVEELHDVEMVKHDGGFRKMVHHRARVRRRPIDGNGFNRCTGVVQSFPEGFQCVGPLAVADEYDGAAFEVERHGDIMMPFLHRDLVDGHVAEILQRRAGELLLQVPLLDILDGIPGNREMPGHIEDRHMFREFEDIPLESAGIGKPGVGKAELHLADRIAPPARHPLDVKIQKDHLRSYRNHAEPPR